MLRPALLISASLLATLSLSASIAFAQDLSPTKPPSGTETPTTRPAEPVPPAADAPRRPNAQPGGGAGGGRRNADPANIQIPDDIQLVRDVVYSTAPGKDNKSTELKMDCAFLKQSNGKPMPVIIYIHGGGWSGGNRAIGLPFSVAFARGGYFACTISYRLSGQAIFPAQVHDVKAAVRFLREHAEQLAIDPNRIGVWGHSAGGHLSAMLGVTGNDHTLDGVAGNQFSDSTVQAVVDVSGPTDLVRIAPGGNGGPMIAQFLGGTVRDKPDAAKAASPINYVDGQDAPFLIIQGGQDNLVPDEQAEIMHKALTEAGVECEYLYIAESGHGVPDRRSFQATAAFFDKHLGGDSVATFAELGRQLPRLGGGEDGAAPADRPRRRPNAQPQPATQPQ